MPQVCKDAAATMARLRCEGWRGSPGKDERYGTADDVPFDRVCTDYEAASGEARAFSLHPECIVTAKTCSAVAACAR